ncbi:killer cell lectin-like receptor subfamily F member 1 [Anolis carolinensis]|uniref:killer cell lectin-like receptor subfamily F member 1 n=1 Tax=Anolis carolinensis TaxID=28377 RepID=UPI002F2B3DFE
MASGITYADIKVSEGSSGRKNKDAIQQEDNESCSLCPMAWLPHKNECYWFSNSIQSWKKSKEDCITRKSQLAVLYDQDVKVKSSKWVHCCYELSTGYLHLELIHSKGIIKIWIGLSGPLSDKNTWIWDNGSPVNQTL